MHGAFRMGVPDANFPYVDVRDVVSAHLMVAEQDAQGRFLAINDEQPHFRKMLDVMHAIDPRVKPPLMAMPDFMIPALPLVVGVQSRHANPVYRWRTSGVYAPITVRSSVAQAARKAST